MTIVPTWATLGVEEMRRGMMLMLQGNPHFTWQQKDNQYYPCRDLEQLRRFEQDIFEGIKSPGFYPIRRDNLTRWSVVDFDNHDGRFPRNHWLNDAQCTFDRLAQRFAETWLEESSPGSFHVCAINYELMPARDIRQILRECAPNHPNVEIYPKQDELSPEKPMGNCLRFPGRHQYRGCWSSFIARNGHISDVDGIAPAAKWQAPCRGEQLLSIYVQVTRDLHLTGSDQRFNSMQRVAGRLKGKMLDGKPVGEDIAVEIHDRFYSENSAYIKTSIEKSRQYFLTWFRKAAPCNVEIRDYPLTPKQQALINGLPKLPDIRRELLAATVHLFLNAKLYSDEQGREMFLSLPYIARHLGVSIATASNYRNACYRVGLIEMVIRGSSVTGRASTYKLSEEWES